MMGACGCGELQPLARLKADKNKWYLLEVYPGCTYCGTSWGVGVTLIKENRDFDEEWGSVPIIELNKNLDQWGFPILDTEILKQEFKDVLQDQDELSAPNFAMEEFVESDGLQNVFWKTVKKFDEKQKQETELVKARGEEVEL